MSTSFPRAYSLTTLIGACIAAVGVPLLALLSLAVFYYVSSSRDALEMRAARLTHDLTLKLDLELKSAKLALEALATSPVLRSLEVAAFDRQARDFVRQLGGAILLYDSAGRQIVNTRLASVPDPDLTPRFPDLARAERAQAPEISELRHFRSGGEPYVAIAVPLRAADRLESILVFILPVERFQSLIESSAIAPPFYGSIVDSKGLIVARSAEPSRFRGTRMPQFEQAQGQSGRVRATNPQGVDVIGFYQRSAASAWTVTIGISEAALAAPLTRSLWVIGLGCVVTIALVGLSCAVLVRRISRARDGLLAIAGDLAAQRVATAKSSGVAEIDSIARSIVQGSSIIQAQNGALSAANQSLEHRIAQRTAELAAKNQLLETTLQSMDQGLVMVDGDDKLTLANARALGLLDLPADLVSRRPTSQDVLDHQRSTGEFEGESVADQARFHPAHDPRGITIYERTRPNGVTLEVRTNPIPGGGVVRTYTDITERKRAESALAEARARADEASAAKTRFVAAVSHELRTPLTAIVGHAELLQDREDLPEDARARVGAIATASQSLIAIVDEVLDFAAIEAGKLILRVSAFRVADLLEEAIMVATPPGSREPVAVSIAPDVGASIAADRTKLRQVLVNILGNAMKFAGNGLVSVTVSRIEEGQLSIEIADCGPGLPPDALDRLYSPFDRLGAEMTAISGVGLGLPISRRLVEAMRGQLIATNGATGGATFTVRLPAPRVAVDAASEPAAALAWAPSPSNASRILIVDDVATNREIAGAYLAGAGYVVEAVGDGQTALARLADTRFDLVLMDIRMAGLDGAATTQRLRAGSASSRAVPVVAMTANAYAEQIAAFRAGGFDDHVAKPFLRATLVDAVARNLNTDFDRDVFNDLAAVMPEEALARHVAALKHLLASVAEAEGHKLADVAHDLVSSAGLAGLVRISELALVLEAAARAQPADLAAVTAMRGAIMRAAIVADRLTAQPFEAAA